MLAVLMNQSYLEARLPARLTIQQKFKQVGGKVVRL